MECPKCRKPVPDGFTTCSVCGIRLVLAKAEVMDGQYYRARIGTI